MRQVLLLLALPLLFVVPSLWPGQRFLPISSSAFEPLAAERETETRADLERADLWTLERITTSLVDDVAIQRAWQSGELPTWDPNAGVGRPLAATAAHGAWYPFNVLSWILPPDLAAGFEALIALFLAGLGVQLYLSARALPSYARVFGAWAIQAGGFALVNLHLSMKVDAALWLPFALYGVERVTQRKRYGGIVIALSIAASGLSGFLPIAVFVSVATLVYALWSGITTRSRRACAHGAAWIAVGVLIAAIAWMPQLEARREAQSAESSATRVENQALPIASVATLLLPTLFGEPSEQHGAADDAVVWWLTRASETELAQHADALEWNSFAGVAVLVLALVGIVSRPRDCAALLALLVLSIAFALGAPLLNLLARVPGFDWGPPSRALCIAWVCWPILAALGLQALVERRARALRTAISVALAITLAAGAAALVFDPGALARTLPRTIAERHGLDVSVVAQNARPELVQAGLERVQSGVEMLTLVSFAILVAVLSTAYHTRSSKRVLAESEAGRFERSRWFALRRCVTNHAFAASFGWFVIVPCEGFMLARTHLAPRAVGDRAVFPESEAMEAIRAAALDGRVVRFEARNAPSGADLAQPNLLGAYGIADLTPKSEFTPRSLIEFQAALDPQGVWRSDGIRLTDPRVLGARTLDLLRVTCVLARTPIADPRLRLAYERPGFYVYARSGAFARARVVPSEPIVAQSSESALQLLTDEGHDPRRAVVIAAGDLPPAEQLPLSNAGLFKPGEIQVTAKSSSRIELRVTASSGGWLVLHDQFFPGWKARVDDVDVPIVRADHVYRAVALPPGDSRVEMVYAPSSLRIGALISIAAILAAMFVAVRGARRLRPA